jgi:hypothetical protein
MTPSYRIEIVIEEPLAPRVVSVFKKLQVPGYTLIPRAGGSGDRGIRRGDELAGDSSNCVFLVICDDRALVDRITDALQPILTNYGGVCAVSPCEALTH